jgi:hypothetical protein
MISAEEWWEQNEAFWRKNPEYYANLEQKASIHGKEWVRKHKPILDKYWDYMVISREYADAQLPRGYEKHSAWLLEREEESRRRSGRGASRGYMLYELEFLAGEGSLLDDEEFERRLAAGESIPSEKERD